ncbi:MAG: hypothetical protein ACLQGV_13475 [Bryobacteraceae bacterium]
MLGQQAATPALAKYLNDHRAFLAFNAYLWKTIVIAQYGRGGNQGLPSADPSSAQRAVETAGPVHEMNIHTQYFCQMTFCRGVDSFLVYISDLLSTIFRTRPEILKSKETVTLDFLIEHLAAEDLILALVEKKVNALAYLGMKDVAEFFQKKLALPLFTDSADLVKATIYVDIRNLITHNRGVVNRLFKQRQPAVPAELGTSIEFESDSQAGEMLGFLVHCARDLDTRAASKFSLPTILPIPRDGAVE